MRHPFIVRSTITGLILVLLGWARYSRPLYKGDGIARRLSDADAVIVGPTITGPLGNGT